MSENYVGELRQLVFSSGSSFILKIIAGILAIVVNVGVSRYVGQDASGEFFYFISLLAFFSLFSRFGMDVSVLRFFPPILLRRDSGEVVSFIVVLIKLLCITSLATLLIVGALYLLGLIFTLDSVVTRGFAFVLLGVVPYSVIMISSQVFRAGKKSSASVVTAEILLPMVFLFLILLQYFSLGRDEVASLYNVYLCSLVIAGIITLFLSAVWLKKWFHPESVSIPFLFNGLVASCAPLFLVSLSGFLLVSGGTIFLGVMAEPGDVANYHVANRMALIIGVFISSYNVYMAPRISELLAENRIEFLEKLVSRSIFIMSLLLLPVIFFCLYFSREIMSLYGDGFSDASIIFDIFLIAGFVNLLFGPVGFFLTLSGQERRLARWSVCFSVLQIIVWSVLIPAYGAIGAAAGYLLVMLFSNFFYSYKVYCSLGVRMLPIIWILPVRQCEKEK